MTFAERMANPQTNVDRYVATAYRASVESAGRSWRAELKRLGAAAKPEAKQTGRNLTTQEHARVRADLAERRVEWGQIPKHHQDHIAGGFNAFVVLRDAGHVDRHGRPARTRPKRQQA